MTNFRLYDDSDGNKSPSRTTTINLIDSDVVGLLQSVYEISINPDYFEESEFDNIERNDDSLTFTYRPQELEDTTIHFKCYYDYLMSEWRYQLKSYYKDNLEYDCDRQAHDRIASWIVMINHDLRKSNQLTKVSDRYSFFAISHVISIAEPSCVEFRDKKDSSKVVYIKIDDLKLAQRSQDLHLYKDQKSTIPAKDNLKLQNEIFEWSITRNNQYHLMNKRVAELICDQSLYSKTYYDSLEHWDRSLARTAKDSE